MLLQGLGTGLQINQLQQQQAEQQASRLREAKMNAELEAASRDPRLIPSLMVRYPQLAKNLQIGLDGSTAEQHRGMLANNAELGSALISGRPDLAVEFLTRQQELRRNQGDTQGAEALGGMIQQAKENPDGLMLATLARVNFIPGGEKVAEGLLKLFDERRKAAKAPAELRQTEADADIKEADARAARRGKLAPAVQETLDFLKLSTEEQETFRGLKRLSQPVTKIGITNLEKGAQGELAKLVPDLYSQANSAAGQLNDIPRYRAAIKGAITGPLAEQRLTAARVANALGWAGDEGVKATATLVQGLAEMALQSRSMLTGQGQITEGEQKLLERARSGSINFTGAELDTIFGVAERAANSQYDQSKRLLEGAAKNSETAALFVQNVRPKPTSAPSAPRAAVEPTATNPQTGEKIVLRNGQWVPLK
jgi:hypothetical protein